MFIIKVIVLLLLRRVDNMSNSIDILDIIVRAAVQARVDYVERTQINKLYEIAWEFDVNKYAFKRDIRIIYP